MAKKLYREIDARTRGYWFSNLNGIRLTLACQILKTVAQILVLGRERSKLSKTFGVMPKEEDYAKDFAVQSKEATYDERSFSPV